MIRKYREERADKWFKENPTEEIYDEYILINKMCYKKNKNGYFSETSYDKNKLIYFYIYGIDKNNNIGIEFMNIIIPRIFNREKNKLKHFKKYKQKPYTEAILYNNGNVHTMYYEERNGHWEVWKHDKKEDIIYIYFCIKHVFNHNFMSNDDIGFMSIIQK